jgi:hypothetical protein
MKPVSKCWDVPMPIKLDWRFTALQHVARIHMKELQSFSQQAEAQFADAMKSWNDGSTGLTEEEEEMMADYLMERRDNIESLLDRGNTLGILGLYAFFERFLNEVVDHLRVGGAPIPQSKKGFTLYQLRTHLQSVGIDMNAAPFNWNELDKLREIRNCIAHTNGWVTDDFARRLNSLGMNMKVDTQLPLPENFFRDSWSLVNETYSLVFTKAWEEFGHEKQYELWLRPTRSFADTELGAILDEAVNVGIAARENATKALLQDVKRHGLQDEDSCGWVWLELDPAFLKQIHQLKIPNINTSYNTTAIVEDFRLYLNDVSHYQRLSASRRGIEAAAKVLRNYGINSTVGSMAD